MLRENLDTVLKELLEFKKNEIIPTTYPGPHLDVHDELFTYIHQCKYVQNNPGNIFVDVIVKSNSKELINYTINKDSDENKESKSEIINRIKRYIYTKSKDKMNFMSQLSNNFQNHENLHKSHKIKRYTKAKVKYNMNFHKNESSLNNNHNYRIRVGRHLNSFKKLKRRKKSIETILSKIKKSHKTFNDPAKGDAALKARFLFKSCMNHEILAKRGHQPLLDLLDFLGGWPIIKPGWKSENFDWLELMAKLRLFNNDILISEWVGPDIKKSDEFVIQFDQTSLGN